ncbi:hypothetical protein PQG02_06935 [Nostoc sp. UHCC 0926]|uniref:hypothetical protein n=1 Tax=unclassified Nostoc TaxID=2593658 RepID=UPI00235FC861|nr:hypothetical protein [Nostoc sp. UHCC 0926]WDD34076.1 hypothetical protein PQG02_06935 [Nostoc sp. UHCC 0926]
MTTPDFLDRLASLFQSAIASIQENIQLRAENAQLKTANANLTLKLDTITSSFNEDEQEKATTATKLAGLEQLMSEYESIGTPAA